MVKIKPDLSAKDFLKQSRSLKKEVAPTQPNKQQKMVALIAFLLASVVMGTSVATSIMGMKAAAEITLAIGLMLFFVPFAILFYLAIIDLGKQINLYKQRQLQKKVVEVIQILK